MGVALLHFLVNLVIEVSLLLIRINYFVVNFVELVQFMGVLLKLFVRGIVSSYGFLPLCRTLLLSILKCPIPRTTMSVVPYHLGLL